VVVTWLIDFIALPLKAKEFDLYLDCNFKQKFQLGRSALLYIHFLQMDVSPDMNKLDVKSGNLNLT